MELIAWDSAVLGAFAGEGGLDDVATGSTTPNSIAATVGDTQHNSPPPPTPNPTGAFVGEGGLDDLGIGSTTPNSTVENLRWLPTSVSRSLNFLVNQSGKRRGARNRRVPARLGSTDYIRISSLVQDVQTTPSPTGPSSLLVHEGTTPPRLEGPSCDEGTTPLRLEAESRTRTIASLLKPRPSPKLVFHVSRSGKRRSVRMRRAPARFSISLRRRRRRN
ncbi:hypothetical protein ACSBR2_004630 [Camellia fascicularis]